MAAELRKLNLGCGFDKREGFLNVDGFAGCQPDQLWDLETTPWPWADNAFDHVLMKHVLEHVGADFKSFAAIMRELYRVTAPGGILEVHVPDPRHEAWWADPTHVRAFTLLTFRMMSKAQNDRWIADGANYTMLAYLLDVDFEIVDGNRAYDGKWVAKLNSGELTQAQFLANSEQLWGVAQELRVRLRPIKPEPAP
jgi:SAM-dependent methyltransferase